MQHPTTQRMVGQHELAADDVFATITDFVGCVDDWRKRSRVHEAPYQTLIHATYPNLIAALATRRTPLSVPVEKMPEFLAKKGVLVHMG